MTAVALNLDVEADHDRVRRAREQDVGFGNRADAGMNDLEIDFLALDLTERADQRFERTLRVAFQNDAQNFLAVGGFEQTFERGALRRRSVFPCASQPDVLRSKFSPSAPIP